MHVTPPLKETMSSPAQHGTEGPLRMSQLRPPPFEAVMFYTNSDADQEARGGDRLLPLDRL